MALCKTISAKCNFGISVDINSAYIRVSGISGNKDLITFTVDILTSDKDICCLQKTYQFTPDLDGGNFIQQSYSHLKNNEFFSGSVDC